MENVDRYRSVKENYEDCNNELVKSLKKLFDNKKKLGRGRKKRIKENKRIK
jgi:hypothetical protein